MKDAITPQIIDTWEPMCTIPPRYNKNRTAMITDVKLNVGDYFRWHVANPLKGDIWYKIKAIEYFLDRGERAQKNSASNVGTHAMKATKYFYKLEVESAEEPAELMPAPVEQEQ